VLIRSSQASAPDARPRRWRGYTTAPRGLAFYASPFERAAVLCIVAWAVAYDHDLARKRRAAGARQLDFVSSLAGSSVFAFTSYCGFKVDSGEYKLMGLAPYGRPVYSDTIRDILIRLREDGSFTLNLDYFEFLRGERMMAKDSRSCSEDRRDSRRIL